MTIPVLKAIVKPFIMNEVCKKNAKVTEGAGANLLFIKPSKTFICLFLIYLKK